MLKRAARSVASVLHVVADVIDSLLEEPQLSPPENACDGCGADMPARRDGGTTCDDCLSGENAPDTYPPPPEGVAGPLTPEGLDMLAPRIPPPPRVPDEPLVGSIADRNRTIRTGAR
jgi:hypothetical protein